MNSYFKNTFLSDCQLQFSSEHVIPAHAIMLASASKTFKTFFENFHPMNQGLIHVPLEFHESHLDNKDILETVVQYFYEQNIECLYNSNSFRYEHLHSYFSIFEALECEKALFDMNIYFIDHYFENLTKALNLLK